MNRAASSTLRQIFPFLRWWSRIDRRTLRADALAGLTNAIVVLPQGVAFAIIAGLPPQYGLYTAIFPAIIAALWGSSWHLISGPTLALSIVIFSTLAPIATPGTAEYIGLALALTFFCGLYQLAFGFARLGMLVNFVSPAVVTGFISGAAILVVTSQLRYVLGIDIPRDLGFVETWIHGVSHLGEADWRVISIAMTSFAVAVGVRYYRPNWPWLLLSMLAGVVAGIVLNAPGHGVNTVGAIPRELPPVQLPPLDLDTIRGLAPEALALALLGLIEAVSISRGIALRSHQRLDSNQEFIGQGLSNVVGACFSSYASSGSLTRSGINYEAGARTPVSALCAAGFLALIVLVLAPWGEWLPTAAMAGMILVVAWNLVDRQYIREILRASRQDSVVLIVTFVSTLLFDLAFAILAGVLLSLVLFLTRAANPSVFSVAPDPSHPKRRFKSLRLRDLTECPQLKIVRVDGPLFFGSVQTIDEVLTRFGEGADARRHLLINCSGVPYLDSAAAQMLVHQRARYRERGGDLYLCGLRMDARLFLRRSGYATQFGRENIFRTKGDAIEQIFERLDGDICARCTARIFQECKRIPPPPGHDDPDDYPYDYDLVDMPNPAPGTGERG